MKIIDPIRPYRPGSQKVICGKGQKEYSELPALRYNDKEGTVCSFYKLSLLERIRLLFRGIICLELLTFHKPINPQRLFVYPDSDPELFIVVERDGKSFCAYWSDFVNLQITPAGFGDTRGEAVENLIKETGIRLQDAKIIMKNEIKED